MSTETIPETGKTVLVKIENSYSDGHESVLTQSVTAPESLDDEVVEAWWDDDVFALTGDGYGAANPDLDSSYSATVIDGPAELVGKTREW